MEAKDIYDKFRKWNPHLNREVKSYCQWGSNSICLWLKNGLKYKAKLYDDNKFIMQPLTDEDIRKKFGESNE